MGYLVLNGITVQTASAVKRRVPIGKRRVALMGDSRNARRADRMKDEWDVGTIALPVANANALEVILAGRCHVWDFDGSWSSSGAAGARATSSLSLIFGGGPYADTNYGRVASAGSVDLVGNLGDRWSIIATRKDTTWKGYAFRSTGFYSVGAVMQASSTLPWLTKQSNGDIRLSGKDDAGSNAVLDVGQIVAIPAVLPDALLLQASAWLTRRWGAQPVLDVSGDFTPRAYMHARATMNEGNHVPGPTERRVLSFTIRQAEGA